MGDYETVLWWKKGLYGDDNRIPWVFSKDGSVSLETWNDFLLGSWLFCLESWIGGKPSDVEGFRDYEGSARA